MKGRARGLKGRTHAPAGEVGKGYEHRLMKAAVFHGPRDIRVEMVECPRIEASDVLLKVMACGICGTDIHIYKKGVFMDLKEPHIMGHEWSG